MSCRDNRDLCMHRECKPIYRKRRFSIRAQSRCTKRRARRSFRDRFRRTRRCKDGIRLRRRLPGMRRLCKRFLCCAEHSAQNMLFGTIRSVCRNLRVLRTPDFRNCPNMCRRAVGIYPCIRRRCTLVPGSKSSDPVRNCRPNRLRMTCRSGDIRRRTTKPRSGRRRTIRRAIRAYLRN